MTIQAIEVLASLSALASFSLTMSALRSMKGVPPDIRAFMDRPVVSLVLAFGATYAATTNTRATVIAFVIAAVAAIAYNDVKRDLPTPEEDEE